MEFTLIIHNLFRWLILISLITIMIKWIFYNIQPQKTNHTSHYFKKISLFLIILVDIQFILGIILYLGSSSIMNAFKQFSSVMKIKELRFFVVEHPVLMIIMILFIHYLHISIKKSDNPLQNKKVILISFIALLIAILGIPWFRPFIRF